MMIVELVIVAVAVASLIVLAVLLLRKWRRERQARAELEAKRAATAGGSPLFPQGGSGMRPGRVPLRRPVVPEPVNVVGELPPATEDTTAAAAATARAAGAETPAAAHPQGQTPQQHPAQTQTAGVSAAGTGGSFGAAQGGVDDAFEDDGITSWTDAMFTSGVHDTTEPEPAVSAEPAAGSVRVTDPSLWPDMSGEAGTASAQAAAPAGQVWSPSGVSNDGHEPVEAQHPSASITPEAGAAQPEQTDRPGVNEEGYRPRHASPVPPDTRGIPADLVDQAAKLQEAAAAQDTAAEQAAAKPEPEQRAGIQVGDTFIPAVDQPGEEQMPEEYRKRIEDIERAYAAQYGELESGALRALEDAINSSEEHIGQLTSKLAEESRKRRELEGSLEDAQKTVESLREKLAQRQARPTDGAGGASNGPRDSEAGR